MLNAAQTLATTRQRAIRRTDGTIVAQVGSNGFESFLDPSINNAGAVAFKGRRNGEFGMYSCCTSPPTGALEWRHPRSWERGLIEV